MHYLNSDLENVVHTLTALEGVIISSWESIFRKSLSPEKQLPGPTLIDHLPEILESLKYVLERDHGGHEVILGKAHGFQRAHLTNFSLSDLLNEYRVLRQVLIYNLYPFGNICGAQKLHRYLDDLCMNAVSEFLIEKQAKINVDRANPFNN